MTHSEFINKVIRVRQGIISRKKSIRPDGKCLQIITKLKLHVEAYGDRWTAEEWKTFIKNNYYDIIYIIPGNKSKRHYEETLNALIL